MLTSIDGKVTGDYLSGEAGAQMCEDYYKIHREYGSDGFICGRITMEGSFTGGKSPELEKYVGVNVEKGDYVAKKADFYAVSLDPRGVVGWYGSDIVDSDPGYDKAHIIEVLTERASEEYKAFLRDTGISYVLCGKEKIDVRELCSKLSELFGIKKIMLEGGGKTDTAFLEDDLIDEISLVMCPLIDTGTGGIDLFSGKTVTQSVTRGFRLLDAEKTASGALWLKFLAGENRC